ncbi:MAG: SsrA-binding protein SmpB [Candidatus Omnitrophota bacterium]|jgi:SsrA-binding protein
MTAPVATNRKARYDYFLFEKYEAGIALKGCEVKSIREGRINLKESFVRIIRGEAFLMNCHITPYSKIQGYVEIDPIRSRKLLLKKVEIARMEGKVAQKGFSIVPVSVYFKKGRAKVEIAVAQGKKQFDKREDIKRRIHDRETEAAIKQHSRQSEK